MQRRTAASDVPPKPEWRQPNYKDVVRDRFCFTENLPLCRVHYPDIYGTWIYFQESEGSQPMLCACMKLAVRNFLLITAQSPLFAPFPNLVEAIFPPRLRPLNRCAISSIDQVDVLPFFQLHACHLCNRRVPSIRWSNLDEHSAFLQHFGWYFHHALYAAGVSPYGDVLQGSLDPEVRSLILLDQEAVRAEIRQLLGKRSYLHVALDGPPTRFDTPELTEARELDRRLKLQKKGVWLLIEQRLRVMLGFPVHKKTGVSETILHWIVTAIFSPDRVLFRSKPSFLDGLELDIFVPARRLAIEFQGEQHYIPFRHLGGEKHLRSVRRRDRIKEQRCKEAGVRIEYFSRVDKLAEDFVRDRLRSYLEEESGL
jgi:hypothetical protein